MYFLQPAPTKKAQYFGNLYIIERGEKIRSANDNTSITGKSMVFIHLFVLPLTAIHLTTAFSLMGVHKMG